LLSWSCGKDSAWCLHLLRQQNEYEIVALLFNQEANRVALWVSVGFIAALFDSSLKIRKNLKPDGERKLAIEA
jgi:hypothetical protein